MPYKLTWYDAEKTILHILSEGKITWDEYHERYAEALKVVKAEKNRIDIVMVSNDGMPPGNPVPHQRKLIAQWNGVENLGLVMMVSTNRIRGFVRTTTDIASRMESSSLIDRVIFVDTVAEAIAAIEANRASSGSMDENTIS
jgi:hypothetical protein